MNDFLGYFGLVSIASNMFILCWVSFLSVSSRKRGIRLKRLPVWMIPCLFFSALAFPLAWLIGKLDDRLSYWLVVIVSFIAGFVACFAVI